MTYILKIEQTNEQKLEILSNVKRGCEQRGNSWTEAKERLLGYDEATIQPCHTRQIFTFKEC